MKKLTLTLCAVVAVVSASFAGTSSYSGKEMKQVETPCPQWYADNEWNIGVSFAYAANVSNDDNSPFLFDDSWDDAFGGSLDVKYFFHRYWGIGFQGTILGTDQNDNNGVFNNNDDTNFVGSALATFTFRYAPPCSRFAPYLWVGIGGYFNDNNNDNRLARFTNDDSNDGAFMGQFGAGFEVRITPHIGWTSDVSFNDVEGGNHDFVMIRTGLNFAF